MTTIKGFLYSILTIISIPLIIVAVLMLRDGHASTKPASNQVIVKYRAASLGQVMMQQASGSKESFVLRMESRKNLKVAQSFMQFNMVAFDVSAGTSVEAVINDLADDPNVEFVEPNYVISANRFAISAFGSEPFSSSPSVSVVSIEPQADDPIVVAVVDTGVDGSHTAFSGRMFANSGEVANDGIDNDGNGYVDDVSGWNFANNNNNAFDDHGHGTHVAGTIAGVSASGTDTSGNYKIVPLKFLDADGYGSTLGAISAIAYGLSVGVNVFNNSWGGGGFSMALHDVISQSYNAGSLFVVAAGNDGTNIDQFPSYPASYTQPNILSVAAVDSFGSMAWFSNFGKQAVDVAAPGVSIYSAAPNNQYAYMSGTSMATPYVSRVAMMMMDQNRDLSVFQVKDIIMDTVNVDSALAATILSSGSIDSDQAILSASNTVGSDFVPAYDDSLASFLDNNPTDSVSMGPQGCAFTSSGGSNGLGGGDFVSLMFYIIMMFVIRFASRIELALIKTSVIPRLDRGI